MSTRAFSKYIDGYYGVPRLLTRTPSDYPFDKFGDNVTERYTGTWRVDQAAYVKTALSTVDPDNPGFYLLAETKLDITQGDLADFTRTYCNPPAGYSRGGEITYSRPIVPGTGQNRSYGSEANGNAGFFYQPDTTLERFHGYSRRAVATDQGVGNVPSGGTYTLTFGGDTTTSLNYNDAAATVKTALDALTSVTGYGGLATLTGNYNADAGFLATFNNFAAATLGTGSVSVPEGVLQTGVVTSNGGWTQQVSLQLILNSSPRANFGGTLDTSGLTGYSSTSEGVTDLRQPGNAEYAEQAVGIESSSVISGGTFTLTIFGQTTAPIAYNATLVAAAAALNALSNVQAHGGVTLRNFFGDPSNLTIFEDLGSTSRILFSASFGLPRLGGTYDLTLFSQTASGIAYNASLAAIETALNALSNVTARGGVVVTGAGLSANGTTISFTLTFSAAAITGTSSLTTAPGSVTVGLVSGTNGRQQTIKLTASQVARLLTFTNPHGFTAGEPIYLKMGSTYYLDRTDWAYVSATQISVDPSLAPWSTNTSITEGGEYRGVYEPGQADHRARIDVAFYWPGITSGITTFLDIPKAAPAISDARYLDAFVNGDDYVSYSSGGLGLWEGPVYQRETTYIAPERGEEEA